MRGGNRIGLPLQRVLTPADLGPVSCRLRDGSKVTLDLRSSTEARVFWTGVHDPFVAGIASRLRPDAVVVDVGAHIGLFAVPLGRRLLPGGGKVLAFEPVPENADRLRLNIAANGLDACVSVFERAVGASERPVVLKLTEPRAATSNAFVTRDLDEAQPHRVRARMITLDGALADLDRCQVLKIDVEGGELDVLIGARRLLARCRPAVLLELNRHRMGEAGWTVEDLLAFATEAGYELGPVSGRAVENVWLTPAGRQPL